MNKYLFRARAVVIALALSFVCIFTAGCGEDGDLGDFVVENINNGSFSGNFVGSATIGNNQASTINLTTSNSAASGSLTINAPVVAQTTIAPGTYAFNGAVDTASGSFLVNGTIPGVGTFSISGSLPSGSGQGGYILTINGESFNGVLQASSQGTPDPNTDPGTGGGTGGTSTAISGGTLTNFLFAPDGSYNGAAPPVSGTSIISGAVAEGQDGTESVSFVVTEINTPAQTSQLRTFVVGIVAPTGESLVTGQTYQLASSPTSNGAIIALTTSEGTTAVNGWSLVNETTGQATITARDNTSISVDFEFTNVGPNSEIVDNPSLGTFNTSGTLVGNFVVTQ